MRVMDEKEMRGGGSTRKAGEKTRGASDGAEREGDGGKGDAREARFRKEDVRGEEGERGCSSAPAELWQGRERETRRESVCDQKFDRRPIRTLSTHS